MRTIHLASLGLFALLGCSVVTATQPHGETLREYAGGIPLVVTNATPDKMCGLYLSFDTVLDYGDNWLPPGGLASGASTELAVKPGTYKARWESCSKHGSTPNYAAVLWREMAFDIDHETQLYAYVADTVAPTKRAAVLGRDHVKVMFQGMATLSIRDLPALAPSPQIAAKPVVEPKPEPARFADVIDHKAAAKPAKKKARRPSLGRKHELSERSVAFKAR